MNRIFRKYHRWLAVIFALPLLTTILSGIAFTITVDWFHQRRLARLLLSIHTWEVFGLGDIFPVIVGGGLLGLLVTGVYMTNLVRQQRLSPPS